MEMILCCCFLPVLGFFAFEQAMSDAAHLLVPACRPAAWLQMRPGCEMKKGMWQLSHRR
ncbi:MAG: hypothetical protein GX444_15920 [Myxococcales bacterium]|nr:hypothetical protein [Myxococcales bacterium]